MILSKEKGTFTRAKSFNAEVPERLDLVIDKMLAKDPKHRYQSCEELIRDLNNLGMANAALSFIDGGTPATARSPRAASGVAAGCRVTKTVVAAPAAAAPAGQKEEDKWYLYQIGPDGKPKKIKMSTALIQQQLKAGTLHRND